jgi:leucyl aminopeptidase
LSAVELIDSEKGKTVVPILGVTPATLDEVVGALDPAGRSWVRNTAYAGGEGALALVPDASGALSAVLFGAGNDAFAAGALASLPAGSYRLDSGFRRPDLSALAVALGGYRFGPKAESAEAVVKLVIPDGVDAADLRRTVAAINMARNLINTPANRMGPADLAAAVRRVAAEHQANVSEIVGDDLIARNFPMVHAVGAAAAPGREPRLIDLTWGDPQAPKLTLVGKGVTFDTGGLDIKPSSNMLLMKKDMGGAANALALASMVMGASLPLRLRLLIPAVENAISGAAFRPGDVLDSRKGLAVEIGNTDAEGRLILADALCLASEDAPELIIDFATLTGAARVALGPEVPAIFTSDDVLAGELAGFAEQTADPLWRMPLWKPYMSMIESKVADIDNAGKGGFAGAITAALFLSRFVGEGLRWIHADIFAWNPSSRPARPEGGEAQTIRAMFALLKHRFAAK